MIKKTNKFLQSFWIAKYNIGLRKIFLALSLTLFSVLLVNNYTVNILYVFTLLLLLVFLLKILSTHGYNQLVFSNKDNIFRIYDNKKLFSNNNTRNLHFLDCNISSKVWLSSDMNYLYSAYLNELVLFIEHNFNGNLDNKSILHLGGGTSSIPLFLAKKHTKSKHIVVENNKELTKVSKKYFYKLFGKSKYLNISNINLDAQKFIKGNKNLFNVIIQDIFVDDVIPVSFLSSTWTSKLLKRIHKNGFVIINLSYPKPRLMFDLALELSKSNLSAKKPILIKENLNYYLVIYK